MNQLQWLRSDYCFIAVHFWNCVVYTHKLQENIQCSDFLHWKTHCLFLQLLGRCAILHLFFPNPELPQCEPSGAVNMLINWNTQMSSLSWLCGPWLCLNLYFYESLLICSSVLIILGLKSVTQRENFSLPRFIPDSVFWFVPQSAHTVLCTHMCLWNSLFDRRCRAPDCDQMVAFCA